VGVILPLGVMPLSFLIGSIMVIDFNTLSLDSHFATVAAHKVRASFVVKTAGKNPSLLAAMYASQPTWIHEIPLGQVVQVAEDLCDSGFKAVIADMSDNRAINKEYREVLKAVAQGESVIV
jgi:hypothetical protein